MTINECIEKLKAYTKTIENKANEAVAKLDPETKAQVDAIAAKTSETIRKSIDKLNELKDSATDENSLNDFLDRLDNKCKEIADYTAGKIAQYEPKVEDSLNDFIANLDKETKDTREEIKDKAKETYKDVEFRLNDTYERLLNNSTVQAAGKMVKKGAEKAVEFYNSDETQEFINTMKIKTINIAEKSLEGLKVILDRADDTKAKEDKAEEKTVM